METCVHSKLPTKAISYTCIIQLHTHTCNLVNWYDIYMSLTIVIDNGHHSLTEVGMDTNIALIGLEIKCEMLLVHFGHIVIKNSDIGLHYCCPWLKCEKNA